MEKKRTRKPNDPDKNPYHVLYDNYLDTNACTECTGLMHQAAQGREEWDAYREIFDFTAKPPSPEDDQD